MTDIVERLLEWREEDQADAITLSRHQIIVLLTEIKRLRAEIRQIELNTREGSPLILKINWVARRALEPKP